MFAPSAEFVLECAGGFGIGLGKKIFFFEKIPQMGIDKKLIKYNPQHAD